MSKLWTKFYNIEWIEGSIRVDLAPEERSVWADFLALSGISRREGYIERSKGIPYTLDELAAKLLVDKVIIQSTINKCVKEGRITIDEYGTICITNWHKYQDKTQKQMNKEESIRRNKEAKDSIVGAADILRRAVNQDTVVRQYTSETLDKINDKLEPTVIKVDSDGVIQD